LLSFEKSWYFIVDEDDDRRRMIRMKVKQGVAAAESLKKRIREINSNAGPVISAITTASSQSDNCKFILYRDLNELFLYS